MKRSFPLWALGVVFAVISASGCPGLLEGIDGVTQDATIRVILTGLATGDAVDLRIGRGRREFVVAPGQSSAEVYLETPAGEYEVELEIRRGAERRCAEEEFEFEDDDDDERGEDLEVISFDYRFMRACRPREPGDEPEDEPEREPEGEPESEPENDAGGGASDGGEREPEDDGGEREPEDDGGEREPEDDGGEREPEDDGGEREPEDDGGEREPDDDGGEREPEDDGGEREPEDDGGEPEPEDDGGEPEREDDGGEGQDAGFDAG